MANLEYAIRLMTMAIEKGDQNLIEMAQELIDSLESKQDTQETSPPKPEPVVKRESTVDNNVGDFIFQMKNEQDAEKQNGAPVNLVKNRVNKFVDDGEDRDIATPDIKLTERKRRPFQKVQQMCSRCGSKVEVHPSHKREFFVCDRCIKR